MIACRVLVVLALLVSFVIHVPAAPAREQSSSIKQQPIGKAVPAWVAKPPPDDGKDLKFVGTATSASEPQTFCGWPCDGVATDLRGRTLGRDHGSRMKCSASPFGGSPRSLPRNLPRGMFVT